MKNIIATASVLATVNGSFWFGFCPDVPKVENFDYEKFAGTWYEIYRDKGHHAISNQQCTEDEYKATNKGKSMKLKRKYERKFWHWDIFWNGWSNIGDQLNWEQFDQREAYNLFKKKEDKLDYINHTPWLFTFPWFNNYSPLHF